MSEPHLHSMHQTAFCSACGDLDGCHRWRWAYDGVAEGQRWQHFKGQEYDVVGRATHSESGEALILYRRSDRPAGTVWARPESMWLDAPTFKPTPAAEFAGSTGCLHGMQDKYIDHVTGDYHCSACEGATARFWRIS